MKKWTSGLLAICIGLASALPASFGQFPLDIPVPEFKAAVLDTEGMVEIPAYNKGMELMVQSIFADTSQDPFERHILRMAVQDLAKRSDGVNFRPEEAVTGFETLTYLMRLNGVEADVQQAVLPQTGGLSAGAIQALYNETYAQQALTAGVLEQEEYMNLGQPVTREQIALWIARTLEIDPVFGNLDGVFGFSDYEEVTPENRGIIEALLTTGIMKPLGSGGFQPKETMSRGELMEVLDLASEQLYDQNAIETGFGLVTAIQEEESQEVGYKTTSRDMIIRTVDGQAVKVMTQVNGKTNQRTEFVSFKNGIPSDSRAIEIGDEVAYIVRDGAVIYMEVIDDNTILEKIRQAETEGQDITTYFGHIYETMSHKEWVDDRFIEQSRFRVRTFDGETFDIVVETDLQTGVKNDPIVYKNERVGGTDLLAVGDDLTFAVKNDENIVYINVKPMEQMSISGTVRGVHEDPENNRTTLEVFGYDDQIWEFPVASYAGVEVNKRVGALSDLRYGQDVLLTINQGYITNVVSETFMENPGYIPKYGKVRTATVHIMYKDVILFMLSDGTQQAYTLPDDIPMTKGGTSITKSALREGDKVKLYFDDMYTTTVSKAEVEGIERMVKNVYRGRLGSVNEALSEVTLYDPKYLKNTEWVSSGGYSKKVKLSQKALIYHNGKPVPLRDLDRSYRGDTVYVALEDSYGIEMAQRMTIKSGGENIYAETIKDVNAALDAFELYNNENINLSEGTIVLKEGRLVEPNRLKRSQSVMVVNDFYRGRNTASVVKVTSDLDQVFDRIYIGALEDVNGNNITLRNWATMSGNEWNGIVESDSEKLYYHTDSVIEDHTEDTPVALTPYQLFNNGYSREENASTDGDGLAYERYYAVGVLSDSTNTHNSLVGLNLRHKGLMLKQNWDDTLNKESQVTDQLSEILSNSMLTRGVIDSLDTTWKRVRITDAHDWIRSTAEWQGNPADTYVEYTDALIVRGNEVIEPEDMVSGENIYVLRYREDGLVIFVDSN